MCLPPLCSVVPYSNRKLCTLSSFLSPILALETADLKNNSGFRFDIPKSIEMQPKTINFTPIWSFILHPDEADMKSNGRFGFRIVKNSKIDPIKHFKFYPIFWAHFWLPGSADIKNNGRFGFGIPKIIEIDRYMNYSNRKLQISPPFWSFILHPDEADMKNNSRFGSVSYTHLSCRRSTLCRSRWSPYH